MRLAIVLAVVLLSFATASAGLKASTGVNVDPVNRWANGDAYSARSSPNTLSYITCDVSGFLAPDALPEVFCQARNNSGQSVYCFSSSPSIAQAASSSGPNSYYYFRWNASGQCTYLSVSNSSSWGLIQP